MPYGGVARRSWEEMGPLGWVEWWDTMGKDMEIDISCREMQRNDGSCNRIVIGIEDCTRCCTMLITRKK